MQYGKAILQSIGPVHWRRSLAALLLTQLVACGHPPEPVLTWAYRPLPPVTAADTQQPAARENGPHAQFAIRVLSNRADLLSGGDALVEVALPSGLATPDIQADVDGRDVTDFLVKVDNERFMGLVTGLVEGPNLLTVHVPGVGDQQITLTNHAIGGPIFSGPQLQPWVCRTEEEGLGPPLDAKCNAPTVVSYLYQSVQKPPGQYLPYDPAQPATDVTTTTTDEGHVVPYIIRVEKGTLNRSIYHLAVLADPTKPWTPWQPQQGWNGKLFVPFGGGCGTQYGQLPPVMFNDEQAVLRHEFISRGWMGTASGLNALGQNCNEVLSAEALMMQKELIEEQFGPIRHTIGRGGSGGSIQQFNIAASYPGLLDGVTTDSSFPDSWTAFSDTIDCNLLNRYFYTVSPMKWLGGNKAAVMGKSGTGSCLLWTLLLGDTADPQARGGLRLDINATAEHSCGLPREQRYHPLKNPQGARCAAQDFQAAIWGTRGPRNAVPLPFDNVGVQYGLIPLQQGLISAEQFVDLNSQIGSMDEEGDYIPRRSAMDKEQLDIFYRTSRLSDPIQLSRVPMIDVRNNKDTGDFHAPYMSWVMRARLDKANGHHDNQVIWDHPGDEHKDNAVFAMDHWLTAIEADSSDLPLPQKIVRNRPEGLVDTCWVEGHVTTDEQACRKANPYSGDARIAAGGPLSSDIRKCQLKPLRRTDYRINFSDEQWARLQAVFPMGVCDWSRPGVGYQASVPWLSYAEGPGGKPLGPAPQSRSR